jgi:hypothetical protein
VPCRPTNPEFVVFYEKCIEKFNLSDKTQYRPIITPYLIDPMIVIKLLEEFGGVDNFLTWFVSVDIPSEFMVYDLFAQSQGLEQDPGTHTNISRCFFRGTKGTKLKIEEIQQFVQHPQAKIIAIHHSARLNVHRSQIETVLGLTK